MAAVKVPEEMTVDEILEAVDDCPGAGVVVVNLAGTYVDLVGAALDNDRQALVLELHPDDVTDVLQRIFRLTTPPAGWQKEEV